MPSCKKICAFSAFLAKSIFAIALALAIPLALYYAGALFGEIFIRGLMCENIISSIYTASFLRGGTYWGNSYSTRTMVYKGQREIGPVLALNYFLKKTSPEG